MKKAPMKKAPRPSALAPEVRLEAFAKRLARGSTLKKATALLRLTGTGGGDFCLQCSPEGVHVTKGAPPGEHDIEVMGDAARIHAILEGKRDARAIFLGGGIRVRGNIRYWSDIAYQLGLIKQPV